VTADELDQAISEALDANIAIGPFKCARHLVTVVAWLAYVEPDAGERFVNFLTKPR
jgi:hypothetical protein